MDQDGNVFPELVPARKRGFPLGIGQNDPTVNHEVLRHDEWWRAMNDDEYRAFLGDD